MQPDLHNDREFGQMSLGRGSYFHDSCKFQTYTADERIKIGRYCSIATGATITAGGNHRPELPSTWPFDNIIKQLANPTRTYQIETRHTVIGSDVWIGRDAHIGLGAEIGHGAIIGSCAAVFREIPPYAIVAGNPARVARYRFSDEIIAEMLKIAWWDWPAQLVIDRIEWFYRPIEEFVAEFAPGA
jgi:acetyltransferase-like isoleucine patch superfamily enzyme